MSSVWARRAVCTSWRSRHSEVAQAYELLDLVDASPEALYDIFEERGWGDGLPLVPPTSARVDAMLAALRRRRPRRGGGDACPPDSARPPGASSRSTPCSPAASPSTCPCSSPRSVRWAHRGQPARRQRHDPPGGAAADRARRDRRARRLQQRPRRVRPGQPGERHDGTRPAARAAARRGRGTRPRRRVDAGRAGEVRATASPRTSAATPWEGYAAQSRRRRAVARSRCTAAKRRTTSTTWRATTPSRILDKMRVGDGDAWARTTCASGRASTSSPCAPSTPRPARRARMDAPRHRRRYLFHKARLPVAQVRAHFDSLAWPPWMHGVGRRRAGADDRAPDNIRVFVCGGAGKHSSVRPELGHDLQRHRCRSSPEPPRA